jgi:sarcosine oxidase subunit gamma
MTGKARGSMIEPLPRHEPIASPAARHPSVTIALGGPRTRFSLRTRTPAGLPRAMLTTAPFGDGTALCLGPDEWLLILPDASPAPMVEGVHALTDISHRNVAIEVDGPGAVALLQTGCALDLRRFPVGKATRTLFEGVEIILWRTGKARFHVETWRSFATHLWAVLDLAGGDLG